MEQFILISKGKCCKLKKTGSEQKNVTSKAKRIDSSVFLWPLVTVFRYAEHCYFLGSSGLAELGK